MAYGAWYSPTSAGPPSPRWTPGSSRHSARSEQKVPSTPPAAAQAAAADGPSVSRRPTGTGSSRAADGGGDATTAGRACRRRGRSALRSGPRARGRRLGTGTVRVLACLWWLPGGPVPVGGDRGRQGRKEQPGPDFTVSPNALRRTSRSCLTRASAKMVPSWASSSRTWSSASRAVKSTSTLASTLSTNQRAAPSRRAAASARRRKSWAFCAVCAERSRRCRRR